MVRPRASSLHRIEFCVRIGAETAALVDGFTVKGRWRKDLSVCEGDRGRRLVEDFANWGDTPQEVVRFTRKYGPLEHEPSPASSFSFMASKWTVIQRQFRDYWDAFGRKEYPRHWTGRPAGADEAKAEIPDYRSQVVQIEKELNALASQNKLNDEAIKLIQARSELDKRMQGQAVGEIKLLFARNPTSHWQELQNQFDSLRRSWADLELDPEREYPLWSIENERSALFVRKSGRLIYGAPTLWRFLTLCLFSSPAERLRKCWRPGCSTPYFFARHLKNNFCSEPCAAWGQRLWKLKWWTQHGPRSRYVSCDEDRGKRREELKRVPKGRRKAAKA